jgi:hypothetical protein
MCIKIGFHSYVVDDLSPNPSPARRGEPEPLVPLSSQERGLGVRFLQTVFCVERSHTSFFVRDSN